MKLRILTGATISALIALLALSMTTVAGGWATADDISMPDDVTAGEEFRIDFTLNQHGVTPMDWPDTYFTATSETGETVTFDAVSTEPAGTWFVDVTLPDEGTWTWDIQAHDFYIEKSSHSLDVLPGAGSVAGITRSDLDSAKAPLSEQIASIEAEQQELAAQIATLEALQEENAANTSPAWWITASIAAVATAALILAVIAVAVRRGTLTRFIPEPRAS